MDAAIPAASQSRLTSGHVGDAALHSGLLGPESAFLLKPFPPDALIACARSLLDKARIR